jgi:hypothetical protein
MDPHHLLDNITNLTNCCVCSKDLWAQDGSWHYQISIYMLNRIIRLKIIINQTASALELLARQQAHMCAAIHQNCLALDYLLVEEVGICGKFNHSYCCLQIDDTQQTVTNIATNIRKIAHVPVQTWDGWKLKDWLGGWFSWLFPLLG